MRKINAGDRFVRWTVIERSHRAPGATMYSVRCNCGTERLVAGSNLTAGRSQSCGCLNQELRSERKLVHGHKKKGAETPTYSTWCSMLKRCRTERAYRDIEVCERWSGENGFVNFLADMGERPADPPGWTARVHYWTIDRIDGKGHYEPENCRWATPSEQRINQERMKAGTCIHGHPWTEESTGYQARGRYCKICARAWSKRA